MGFIEGGTAVLFAIIMYAVYWGLAGAQVRKIVIADEEPKLRVFWFFGVAFASIMVWAMVGALVYWVILIWFRIWLRDPHPWRQEILSATGWFPFGLILRHGPFPKGGAQGAVVFLGYPFALLLASGCVAIALRVRDMVAGIANHGRRLGPGTPARTKEIA